MITRQKSYNAQLAIIRNYFRRRPKFCCTAYFRLAAFFSGGFSASDYFSANSAAGGPVYAWHHLQWTGDSLPRKVSKPSSVKVLLTPAFPLSPVVTQLARPIKRDRSTQKPHPHQWFHNTIMESLMWFLSWAISFIISSIQHLRILWRYYRLSIN